MITKRVEDYLNKCFQGLKVQPIANNYVLNSTSVLLKIAKNIATRYSTKQTVVKHKIKFIVLNIID